MMWDKCANKTYKGGNYVSLIMAINDLIHLRNLIVCVCEASQGRGLWRTSALLRVTRPSGMFITNFFYCWLVRWFNHHQTSSMTGDKPCKIRLNETTRKKLQIPTQEQILSAIDLWKAFNLREFLILLALNVFFCGRQI